MKTQVNQIGGEKKGMQKVSQMKLVGTYIIFQERMLGEGQYGKVYEAAEQNNQSKRYAVKVIPSQIFQQSMSNSQMLQKEIDVLKKLRHENLVCLHEISQSPNNLYLFLDYCNGGDLSKYIDNKPQKRLTESEALEFFKQFVNGYQHLYQSKIIHRDIKPENLMLHNGKIKLGDFGFGRFVEGNMNQQHRMSIKCTPIYASPQLLLKEIYSSKCDVWGAGCLLYKMLYGEYPFIGKDMKTLIQDIQNKVRGKEFKFKDDVVVSEDVKNLIRRMFRYDENDRISWEDVFTHPALTKKYNIFNQDDHISEQEKNNPIFQSIMENRNHVLDNELITDHAQNFQVIKVPDYQPMVNNYQQQIRSKSPNPPQINPINKAPGYQQYRAATDDNSNLSKNAYSPSTNPVSNQLSYNNQQYDMSKISNNNIGAYNYSKQKVEQSPINNLVNNNLKPQATQQPRSQTGDFTQYATQQQQAQNYQQIQQQPQTNLQQQPQQLQQVNQDSQSTQPSSLAANLEDPEEDHYRNSLQKFQQQDIELQKIGKVDKMILFLRNQALFADVTMQLVFTARNKYQLNSLIFYELIYSLTGFYNFNLDLLKRILNQSFPNKLINEEEFKIYLNSKQYKKTFQKIEKDSQTANQFFKTLSNGILKEVQQQLNDPATTNYAQVKDFDNFIKAQSQNYKEYRLRFIKVASQALQSLNPEQFEKDINSLRGIRCMQIFIKLDDYMPIQQYLTFDFRFFYDQYVNKIESDKLLKDIKSQAI
ncbi:Serine/Threonine kinase domain protein (macronuclear) [Tetrahymena thermophila SB210]|uniref:Serine/Threonine kinase domain protein n=1 Tax=Tetrahymena thermophila (strain SB210) TaxID=312017 RepID=I7MIF0_TETTS|nr:Serine/Threonine kinase domain protein [Tetrahymena thermophila SB210]EAR92952.1 Serine/Threonine kinase domain protein [Tetrahymena thermophila SB210]|eukprot:XP_001013197.1 Serine/Threonine kinase domain protein [Tetrahymena thermophila SB210]